MSSASRFTRADSSVARGTSLLETLNDLLRAVDGRVILLRPLTAAFDSQRDDVDLQLTESQRQQLIYAAKASSLQGQIHCRIRQCVSGKAELTLWTIDCSEMLKIDLWSNFDQLPRHRRKSISAARLMSTLTSRSERNPADEAADPRIPALRQLAPDIDLCLLLQHLAKKRKSLSAGVCRDRITAACSRLAAWSPDPATVSVPRDLLADLRELARELDRAIIITRKNIALTEQYLVQRLADAPGNRGLRILEPRRSRGWMTDLRKAIMRRLPVIAVTGSDGAGKSSVVTALAMRQPAWHSVVAKKLYRRSLSYQIVSSLFRRVRGLDRGVFDDRFASIVTLRAIPAAWIRLMIKLNPMSQTGHSIPEYESAKAPGPISTATVFDRSVASFLIRDRKSDSPTLSRAARWIERLIPPVTNVLLLTPYAELARRKKEMSACGHQNYQRLLFEQALRQVPIDVILLAGTESADAAAAAIFRILEVNAPSTVEPQNQTDPGPVRKAAA